MSLIMPFLFHIEWLSPEETLYNLAYDMGIVSAPNAHCTLDSVLSSCSPVYPQQTFCWCFYVKSGEKEWDLCEARW